MSNGELRFTPEQITKVQARIEQIRKEKAQAFPVLARGGPEGFKKLEEYERVCDAKLLESLERWLTTAQIKRFKEIDVQQRGIEVLCEYDIADLLSLTSEQRQQLDRVAADVIRRAHEVAARDPFGSFEAEKRFSKEAREKAVGLLTPHQLKVWQELNGRPFELRPNTEPPRPDIGRLPKPPLPSRSYPITGN